MAHDDRQALDKSNDQRFSQCDRQLREKLEELRQSAEKELAVENSVAALTTIVLISK